MGVCACEAEAYKPKFLTSANPHPSRWGFCFARVAHVGRGNCLKSSKGSVRHRSRVPRFDGWRSGNATVCKTVMRGFDPHTVVHSSLKIKCSNGVNGSRAGLRILSLLRCGFDSHFEHQSLCSRSPIWQEALHSKRRQCWFESSREYQMCPRIRTVSVRI